MDFLNQLLLEVLGNQKVVNYVAFLVFTLIGIMLGIHYSYLGRDKKSKLIPDHYSFRFLIQDNLTRIISGLACIFVIVRFSSDFGFQVKYYMAIILGLFYDRVYVTLIQKFEKKARLNEKSNTDS